MSRKRHLLPDVYKTKKRICTSLPQQENGSNWAEESLDGAVITDTKAALMFLKSLFPIDKFERRLPAIIAKHQVYSIVKNRTVVDKELGDLRSSGEIRIFKIGSEANEFYIVFTEDYKEHVLKTTSQYAASRPVIDKFISTIISQTQDVSLNKETMMYTFLFTDEEITQLVKASVLTVRDVGSWWVAIPAAGIFMKSFLRGRKAILTMIKKCKYKEILQKELETRKLPKVARLGILYHIHDIIGAELVQCIETTSGQLLRYNDS